MWLNKSKKILIGVDIGSDFIKIVKGSRQRGKIFVDDFGFRKYQSQASKPGLATGQFSDLLSSMMGEKEIKKAQFYASISSSKVCIRVVNLPVIPQNELYQAVGAKVRKYVSPDLEKVVFNFKVLGETQEKGSKKLEVIFVAVQKSSFNNYFRIFESINVDPTVITASCFSLSNIIRETGLDSQRASLMLLNIENQESDLTVYKRGKFVFTRNIPIGVKNFTDILEQESHRLLQKVDDVNAIWVPGKQLDNEAEKQDSPSNKILELLQAEARALCKEIELTSNHYYQVTHGEKINKCIILGEGSQISGLVTFLQDNAGVTFDTLKIGHDKIQIAADKKEEFDKNMIVYSQALGVLWTGPQDINLATQFKPEIKKGIRPETLVTFLKSNVVFVGFVGLGLIILALMKGIGLYYQVQIDSCKSKLEKLREQKFKIIDINRKMDVLNFKRSLYVQLKKQYPAYHYIITEIFQSIPSGRITLDNLVFETRDARGGPIFTIEGSVIGLDVSRTEVTQFVLMLEETGLFEDISHSTKDDIYERGEEGTEAEIIKFTINGRSKASS